MASGGGHGELYAHVRMYEFKWLCSAHGLDFVDLLLLLGLDTCGGY
jgi:hypothetical protein